MNTSTINTPAELWLRHVLDTEIEPLYRKLQHSKAADQTQAFCSEVQSTQDLLDTSDRRCSAPCRVLAVVVLTLTRSVPAKEFSADTPSISDSWNRCILI